MNEYDKSSHLTSIVTKRVNGTVVASFNYTYDVVGNHVTMTDMDGSHSYTYDALNQLTQSVHPQNFNPTEMFTYDAVGNRITSHLNGTHTYDAANELLGDGKFKYEYDANGNLTKTIEKATGKITQYFYNTQDVYSK